MASACGPMFPDAGRINAKVKVKVKVRVRVRVRVDQFPYADAR